MAGKPPPPIQESYRATVGGHLPVDSGPRQTGATLHPTWRPRLPKEGDAKGAQVGRPALLSAAVGPRGNGLLPARPDVGPTEARDGRVLVVQLREEAVAPPSVHGVPSVGPPDQGALAEGRKGLWVGAPEGASAEMAVEG